uniref:Hyccin n=1 Tax=Onchocerca volvulus TaxID=6282 RepID=A0A8R1TKW9_ONCVO
MNSDQLQDWLTDLNERWKKDAEKKALKDLDYDRVQLIHETRKTHYLISYLSCNYTDVDLVQPVVAQLLSCYYRGGTLRYFVLQCIPSFIHIYLLALAKRQRKSISMFETFFLAIYNEEILANGILSGSVVKKLEEIRIPSIRFPSVYHDPKKFNLTSDIAAKPGTSAFIQKIVRIGPYKSVDRIIPQNRQTVLTRLLKSVNGCLCRLSPDVICQTICLSTIALCQSGFSFRETILGSKVFGGSFHSKGLDDFSKKPRLRISSQYLLESLNGLYFALFNGAPELAVQAVDAVHQRALYEFYADVILVTNSIIETLLENNFHKNDELLTAHWTRPGKLDNRKGNEVVTNASLRLKKMPEDISPVVDNDMKGFNFSDSIENFKKRITVKVEQRKLKRQFEYHRRRSVSGFFFLSLIFALPNENSENRDDIELDPINEKPVPDIAPNPSVSHEAAYQDLHRHLSISHESANSDNDISVSSGQDQFCNGKSLDYSIPAATNSPKAVKTVSVETGIHDLAKWLDNIQHIDSVTDVFEGASP